MVDKNLSSLNGSPSRKVNFSQINHLLYLRIEFIIRVVTHILTIIQININALKVKDK